MSLFRGKITAVFFLSGFAFLGMTGVGSAPERISQISARQFVRSLAGHQPHVADLYLTHGMNVNARAGQDRTILLSTILQGDKRTTQRLLAAGACVDLADENGFTPLMAAALNGDVETVRQLLPLATIPAATDHRGRTALHYAVAAGKLAVVEILLPTMPNLTRPTKDGRSAISLALEQENPGLVDLVLEHFPQGQDWTADTLQILKAAVGFGHKDQIKMLLRGTRRRRHLRKVNMCRFWLTKPPLETPRPAGYCSSAALMRIPCCPTNATPIFSLCYPLGSVITSRETKAFPC